VSTTPADSHRIEVAPDPDDAMSALWLADRSRGTQSAADAKATLAAYNANFRLTYDERGAGYIDGAGEWRAVPAAVAQIRTRRVVLTHVTRASASHEEQPSLVFLDAGGTPLLRMSSLGWPRSKLEHLAALAGWDSDLSGATLDYDRALAEMPGYFSTPYVLMNGATRDPSMGSWLRRRLGRSPSSA
jgi:hypothetical protein